jgi:ribonuclease HI
MELTAVVEALRILPDQMHVWIMMGSAYVKNGIMQWMPNWMANHWKNSRGARVANKTLWEQLLAAVKRMRRVEWSWVKAHDGRLLNECADTLATKGVMNEPRPCPVGFVRVVGEDEDLETYTLLDREETPVDSENDGVYPAGKTFVVKAGDDSPQFLSESESADPNFDEIAQVPAVQWSSDPVPSELEDSDTKPQPP